MKLKAFFITSKGLLLKQITQIVWKVRFAFKAF